MFIVNEHINIMNKIENSRKSLIFYNLSKKQTEIVILLISNGYTVNSYSLKYCRFKMFIYIRSRIALCFVSACNVIGPLG